ncbi:PoNe immunity protein domain-containing protein [Janthinobacterium sp. CG_23.3]|uniref:PoNe immunity protein domain-containing protein n=1 Tax=Janthinobacterium sp. CG_23.3 TaxID=3349634 RepID=UPI0038D4C804
MVTIFVAPKEKRPELMTGYLDDWYHASRREPYHDSHTRGTSFMGYWAWEAAAITYLLDIDDRSFRDAQFYPKDLVDFARSIQAEPTHSGAPVQPDGELRATAGQPCPKTGRWEVLDIPPQVKSYQQGELMLNLGSAYGLTVWRYMDV